MMPVEFPIPPKHLTRCSMRTQCLCESCPKAAQFRFEPVEPHMGVPPHHFCIRHAVLAFAAVIENKNLPPSFWIFLYVRLPKWRQQEDQAMRRLRGLYMFHRRWATELWKNGSPL